MDILAANMGANLAIKKLFANGVIGGEESATIYNDGKGEVTDFGGMLGATYVKISGEPIPLANVNKLVWVINIFGEATRTETKDNLDYHMEGNVLEMLAAEVPGSAGSTESYVLAVSVLADFESDGISFVKGTYVLDAEQEDLYYRVLSLDYTKAVSTIDPKYLPGLTLPVMELSEETAMATLGMGTATVTTEEAAFLDKMAQEKAPFMVLVEVQGMATTCLCQYGGDPESTSYSGCLFGTNRTDGVVVGITLQAFQFRKANGVWQTFYVSKTVS